MLEKYSIHAWIQKHGIRTENGLPFDLKQHSFWFDILSDWHPQQVWLKAAQVGGSLVANLKLFWVVKNKGMNAIYTLPTSHDVKEFVGGKTNLLISQNPILQEWIQDKDTIEQKRIGNNVVYFRGTFTERQALSVSSDLNIHDEVDRSDKLIVDQYSSRQQHSPHKWQWHFSNPSLVGAGVDEKWKLSDKREWMVKCSHCGSREPLQWPESVDFGRSLYVCTHCKGDIGGDRRRGEWVATSDGNAWRGYHISLLMAPWVTPQYLIGESKTKTKEYFWNFVLGLPFEGAGGRLTEDQFFSNLESGINRQERPVVIGLDTGLPNWYVVGNRQGIFYNGSCSGYGEIEQMLKRWPSSILVVDQGGDLTGPRELQERYPGRVYLCYFRSDRKTVSLIDWGKGLEAGRVIVDRNRTIQMLMDEWRMRRIPLFGEKEDYFEMWTHLANMYRTIEEDAMGQPRYVWSRSGADHLILAALYWRIGIDKFGMGDRGAVQPQAFLDNIPYGVEIKDGKSAIPPAPDNEYDWRNI